MVVQSILVAVKKFSPKDEKPKNSYHMRVSFLQNFSPFRSVENTLQSPGINILPDGLMGITFGQKLKSKAT